MTFDGDIHEFDIHNNKQVNDQTFCNGFTRNYIFSIRSCEPTNQLLCDVEEVCDWEKAKDTNVKWNLNI